MRLQLAIALAAALAVPALSAGLAQAEDRADFTTTWYQEQRNGNLGGLTVVHPQFNLATDVGEKTTLDMAYSADAVSGATAVVYSVDAVSSATTFDDVRHVAEAGITFKGRRSSLSIGGSAGVERDYLSVTASIAATVDMPGKNTQLALSYSHNFDEVCDFDNQMVTPLERKSLSLEDCKTKGVVTGVDTMGEAVWRDLSIDTAQSTITQNISPTLVAQASVFGQVLRGFQSNPYRRVRVNGVEAQETVPDVRGRLAAMVRVNKYLTGLHGAMHGMARGYSDTWGVNSFTLGLGYSQYFGTSLLMRLQSRVYQQSEARFFKDAFFYDTEGPAGAFFTGDRELGAIRNIITGAKLSYIKFNEDGSSVWGVFDEVDINLKADMYMLDELPSDPIEENRAGIDNQFLNSGNLLDAFGLMLGLRMSY